MIKPGQVAIVRFPQTDFKKSKPRPVILIAPLPGKYPDWLVCMVSSQLHPLVEKFDEIIDGTSEDFINSGLKCASLIRIGRIAVVDKTLLLGTVGEISKNRLQRIKKKLCEWLES